MIHALVERQETQVYREVHPEEKTSLRRKDVNCLVRRIGQRKKPETITSNRTADLHVKRLCRRLNLDYILFISWKCSLDDTGACQKVVPETQFGLHTFYILKIKCILDDTRVSSSTLPWCPGKRVCQSLVLHHVTNLTNYKIQILIKFYKLYGQQLLKLLCQYSYGSRVQTCDRLKGRVILSNRRIAIQRISVNKTHCAIHRIEI